MVKLCVLPSDIKGGGVKESTKYCHGLAATLLLTALGISSVHYENYEGLNDVFNKEVPVENYIIPNYRLKLLSLVGCCSWGYEEMRELSGTRYMFAYSIMLRNELKSHFENYIAPESEYDVAYYKWEHLESLLFGYHKCHWYYDVFFPIGNFLEYEYNERSKPKRISSPYCQFFDKAVHMKNEWPPIKQGLFDGKYENYKEIYDKSEVYYKENRHICYS